MWCCPCHSIALNIYKQRLITLDTKLDAKLICSVQSPYFPDLGDDTGNELGLGVFLEMNIGKPVGL